jgi:hypothetical protein
MNSPKTPIYFLHDFYQLIYERAVEAQVDAQAKFPDLTDRNTVQHNRDFAKGRAMAYYEVIHSFINQAEIFELDPSEIGFSASDSDSLLRDLSTG